MTKNKKSRIMINQNISGNYHNSTFFMSELTILKIPNSVLDIYDYAFASTKGIDRANLWLPIQFYSAEELARIEITIII